MNEDQWAWLKAQVGLTDEQRPDAEARYARLGTLRNVALEYVRELRARLLRETGFSSVTVPGAISISQSISDQIKALERWIKELEAGPDDPSLPPTDDDDDDPEQRALRVVPIVRARSRSGRVRHPDTW